MSDVVIKVEELSKQYRLGQVGTRTIRHDLNRWFYKMFGKEDPYLVIGEENDRSVKGHSDYVWALRDINFEVKQGEVLGIIGRNGAGKSTLLKILSRVTAPTKGNVKIKGRIASLLEVGTGFHPELTGRNNIYLNGAILGMTKKEIASKFDEIVDFSGVERYIDTPVKRYSSGMYVRLAFAVAAHLDPEILIVDEVLAVGDKEFQRKCLGKMKDVSEREGRTVLFVSHNVAAILNLTDTVMVLEWGKNIFKGSPEDSINYYLSNSRKEHTLPLAVRKDRKGNGMVCCNDIVFLNNQYKTVESVTSGDQLRMRIYYSVNSLEVRSIAFRVQIMDVNEQIVFTCNNAHSKDLLEVSANEGYVTCSIDRLPLFGGTYYVNIQIYSIDSGIHDEVEFAKELIVIDGDFFGTGKIPGVRKGILIHHTWDLENGQ
jgi:lipopolysaccharide transport system ATP-binding protein